MSVLDFPGARKCVIDSVRGAHPHPGVETVALEDAFGRVLARDVLADRDYPPAARSVRDGYAIRSADQKGEFEIAGEVRAGESTGTIVRAGQAVEIMTGALVPEGADCVVMVEHTARTGNLMHTDRRPQPGEFINPAASEARAGAVVAAAGSQLGFPQIAMLATAGVTAPPVFRQPRVAILATGDEIVEIGELPLPYQVRNSNSYSLACQVRRAGGVPLVLPVARDEYGHTRELIERGLESDLLLLSGGVSAGKYDIVERVLADLGAEFFFTRVLIQPGQPVVFGRVRDKFFFGLPGNPASTMVTFEIFARAAVELLEGRAEPRLPLTHAILTRDFRHKPGLTRFLPARLAAEGFEVTPVPWGGSSDVPALARANAFLVAAADREQWAAGEMIPVLMQ